VAQALDLALEFDASGRMARGQIKPGEALDDPFSDARQGFAGGTDGGSSDPVQGALSGGVEGAQAVDLIAE